MSDHSIYLRVSGVYVHGELLSWRLTPPPTYVGLGRFQHGPNVISVHVTPNTTLGVSVDELYLLGISWLAQFIPIPLIPLLSAEGYGGRKPTGRKRNTSGRFCKRHFLSNA